jgi:SAM-dependent methyltransferase
LILPILRGNEQTLVLQAVNYHNEYREFWESMSPERRRVLIACDRPWADSVRHAKIEWAEWILTKNIALHSSPTIAEWGCGIGRLLSTCPIQTARLIGIDMSKSMLSEAVQMVPTAVFLKTEGYDSCLADNSVDFVYSFLVLQHVPNRIMIERIVRTWWRILRRGGFVRAQTMLCPPNAEDSFNGWHGSTFESQEIFGALFTDCGFEIIEEHSGGLCDSPVTDAPAKSGDWIWITARK